MALIVKELQAFDSDPFWLYLRLKCQWNIAAKIPKIVSLSKYLHAWNLSINTAKLTKKHLMN